MVVMVVMVRGDDQRTSKVAWCLRMSCNLIYNFSVQNISNLKYNSLTNRSVLL